MHSRNFGAPIHGTCLAYIHVRYHQSVTQNGESAGEGSMCFKASGVTNRHACRIWGNENPRVTCELERSVPKVNV